MTPDTPTSVEPHVGMYVAALRARVRQLPPVTLALFVALALAFSCAVTVYAPRWWIAGLLALTFAAGGLFGRADQAISEMQTRGLSSNRGALLPFRAVRASALIIVSVAGIACIFLTVGTMLGNIGAGG